MRRITLWSLLVIAFAGCRTPQKKTQPEPVVTSRPGSAMDQMAHDDARRVGQRLDERKRTEPPPPRPPITDYQRGSRTVDQPRLR